MHETCLIIIHDPGMRPENLIRELIGPIDQLIPKGHLAQAKEESPINGLHEESSMSGSGYQSSETMQ